LKDNAIAEDVWQTLIVIKVRVANTAQTVFVLSTVPLNQKIAVTTVKVQPAVIPKLESAFLMNMGEL